MKSIKCPKCGAMNLEIAKKCYKCKKELKETKTCPRCARKNEVNAKRCVSCGFNFNRKKISIWVYLAFSLVLMGVLFLCLYLNKTGVIKRIGIGFRVIAALIVVGVLYAAFTTRKEETLKFDAEDVIKEGNIGLKRMKAASIIAVIIGTLAAGIFVILKFVLKLF